MTLEACAGEVAQAVVSLRDGDFEDLRREVTRFSSSFSVASSDSSFGGGGIASRCLIGVFADDVEDVGSGDELFELVFCALF